MDNPLVKLVEELRPLVDRELCELEALRQLLLQEQQALLTSSAENLQATSLEKESSVGRLERVNQHKAELCACCDLELNQYGLEVLAQVNTPGKLLVEDIRQAVDLSKVCQRQNEINGRIIRAQESASSKLLHILRSETHTPLYSSAGATQGGLSSKLIGSA